MKPLTTLFLFTLIYTTAQAQTSAPSSLRVDLLRDPETVYTHGLKTNLTLEQAITAADQYQFAAVNSRYPTFSWITNSPRQSAYQILLATNAALLRQDSADVWNSGRSETDSSIGVLYKGAALQPNQVYFWKIRTWDKTAIASPYSTVQSFCTGKELENFELPSFVLVKTIQQPQKVEEPAGPSRLYDFGKDAFGQPRLFVNAMNAHDTLVIHLGEALLPDGHINRTPPGSVRYRRIKIPLLQGAHTYEPTIQPDKRNTAKNAVLMPAYIGEVLPFRYMEIENATDSYSVDSISRYAVNREFEEQASNFHSSDSTLNALWDLCKYTIKATSFSGYYLDGDRERIPYEADALINQLSDYSSDAELTMAKRTLDYLIYHPTWPTEWSLQNLQIAWNDYLYTGDLRLVRKLYPELKNKLLSSLARPDGLISTRTGKQTPEFLKATHLSDGNSNTQLRDIVDWPPPNFNGPNSGMGETDGFVFTDYNSVVNAFYYSGLTAMARLATALGQSSDAARYTQEAARVKKAFQSSFFDAKTGVVLDGEGASHSSLHANFFALAFGLVPNDKIAPVLAFIHSRSMACSVYGAQFLLDGLAGVNDPDYALELLTSTEKRSWLNMIREGATMTMEAWGQEYKPNQDWCHAWGTAPANYIVRQLAGIEPLKPGFEEVQIKPHPGSIKNVTLKYRTIRGDIEEQFENKPGKFHLQLLLPGNTIAQVFLPCNSENSIVRMDGHTIKTVCKEGYCPISGVPSGRHSFEIDKVR